MKNFKMYGLVLLVLAGLTACQLNKDLVSSNHQGLISIISPSEGEVVSRNVVLIANVYDSDGIQEVGGWIKDASNVSNRLGVVSGDGKNLARFETNLTTGSYETWVYLKDSVGMLTTGQIRHFTVSSSSSASADGGLGNLTVNLPTNRTLTTLSSIQVEGTASTNGGLPVITVNDSVATLSGMNWNHNVSLNEGTNVLNVQAVWSGWTNVQSIKVIRDTTPPIFAILSPTNGSLQSSDFEISGSASDAFTEVSVYYRTIGEVGFHIATVDHGVWNVNITNQADGVFTTEYFAMDSLSNTTLTQTLFVTVDRSLPSVSILEPKSGMNTNVTSVDFSGSAAVFFGTISSVGLQVNGGGWTSADGLDWHLNGLTLSEGSNVIIARAVTAGGKTNHSAPISIFVDSVAPTIGINGITNGSFLLAGSLGFSGSATDSGSGVSSVWLSVNGLGFNRISQSGSFSTNLDLSAGTVTLDTYTLDKIGNCSLTNHIQVTVTNEVDSIIPVVSVSLPTGEYNNSVSVTLSATDNQDTSPTLYWTTNGSNPTTASSVYISALSFGVQSGTNQITFKAMAVDASGNQSSVQTRTYILIAVSGTVVHFKNTDAWTSPTAYVWTNGNIQLLGDWSGTAMTATENGWYQITVPSTEAFQIIFSDNGANQTGNLSCDGSQTWYNNGTWTAYNPEDSVPPAITITTPSENAFVSGVVSVNVNASDNIAVNYVVYTYAGRSVTTVSNVPFGFDWNTALSPSTNASLIATVYDLAGNSNQTSVSITTSNANVAPVADAGNDKTVLTNAQVTLDASGSYDPNGSVVSYSWDNGASGQNPTVSFSTPGTYVLTLTVTDNDGATNTDIVTLTVVTEIPHRDFREETVYFIMTDRFADGNTANNNIWGNEYLPNGVNDKYNISDTSKSGILSYYHGGDFQGIIDNLDYIQNMGFTAIWITPVVKQPEGRHYYDPNDPVTGGGGDAYQASAFHGYWGYDFDKIDPHLHNSGANSDGWDDFDALVTALHDRGMKLMLDIVVNHGHPTAEASGSQIFGDRQTVIMDGQSWTWETNDSYWNVNEDPHTNGFFSYANGTWLVDLIDFNEHGTQNAVVHLKNVYKRFIDHGVDAFRIDTVAYMTAGFWKDFTTEMKNYAASKGNDYFYMCGEAWTGDRTAAVGLIYDGAAYGFNMLDLHGSSMDFPGWMGNAFKGERGFDDPNGWLRISGADGDASGIYDPTYLATFIDNHDVTRANGILNETQYMNNLNYIYLFRGIPIVYYGTEILYSSWSHYITTTDKNDVVARWMLGSDGINYVKNNHPPLYRQIKLLNALRHSSEALQKGQQSDLHMVGDEAVFKRDAGTHIAFVAMSKGTGFSYTFTGIPNGSYRKITPDNANASYQSQTVSVTDGTYSVTVSNNSFVVLDK